MIIAFALNVLIFFPFELRGHGGGLVMADFKGQQAAGLQRGEPHPQQVVLADPVFAGPLARLQQPCSGETVEGGIT